MKLDKEKFLEIYRNFKIFILKLEKKTRDYFSAQGADIYSRFVRRMFLFFVLAGIAASVMIVIVLLISSIAKPLTKVPDLKGMNVVEASLKVQEKGLVVEMDSKFDPATEKYTVIDQYPKKGMTVRKGRSITLLVSLGRDVYIAPKVVGMNREAAEKMLIESNITYEISVVQTSDTALNTIVSQDIPAGTEVGRAVKMKLLVNSDVSQTDFKVGDYNRQSIDSVVKMLVANGIQPVLEKVPTGNQDDDGLVLSQSVSGGTIIPKNTDIRLQVGVYGEDDLAKQKFNYYVFSYMLAALDSSTTNTNANTNENSPESQANVRLILTDELSSQQEVYSRTMKYGELIVATFKAYGKSKLSLIINNNLVKEVAYE